MTEPQPPLELADKPIISIGASPAIVSRHHHPQPLLRRAFRRLILIGMVVIVIAVAVQLVMAVQIAPLFLGTAGFTLILMIPLLFHSVLHPEVAVTESGLWVRPLVGKRQVIPWSAITSLGPHPLLPDAQTDQLLARKLYGKNAQGRTGIVVVLQQKALDWPLFQLVGQMADVGWRPAFCLSNTTNRDYDQLLMAIQAATGLTITSTERQQ